MKYFFLLISICISQQFYAQQSKSFSVFFENNSAQLSKQSTQVLETILLNKDSIASVKIFGYTNDIGKEERNNLLSVERANIVYEYFKQNGLKISKLARPDGKGKIDLISDAPTTILEQRRNNRKTDIIISYLFTKQKPLEKLVENVKKTPEPSLENLSELSVGNKIMDQDQLLGTKHIFSLI